MEEIAVRGKTLPEAYHKALKCLNDYGKTADCADWNTTQKELAMTIYVEEPLGEPMISKCFIGGPKELEQYRMEMLDGILDFEVGKGNWTYTYHMRYKDQIGFVIDELSKNPSSRRAVMVVRDKMADMYSDDPACFCKGTKVQTPNGEKNIENLKDGDIVYCYDLEKDDYVESEISNWFEKKEECIKIITLLGEISASQDQLFMTTTGWKKAKDLMKDDYILYSDLQINNHHSLWNLIGYLIGDGWISTPVVRDRNIRRKTIGLSVHPDANRINIYNLIRSYTNNKIRFVDRIVNSKIVNGNHRSTKYEVDDYKLHDLLMNYVPCGRKISGNIPFSINDMSKQDMIDFLTGIFSAEGSVTWHNHNIPTIQIGMVWEECISLISDILNFLSISHKLYSSSTNDNNIFKIYITGLQSINTFINSGIDFRYDSRKQIKYLRLKYIVKKTMDNNEIANNNHVKWFKGNIQIQNNSLYIPIDNITSIGEHPVFDFTTNHKDHAIITNNFVCHNCLQIIQYFIRNGKLDCMVLFRSNDAVKATFMNAFALIMLQKKVADELGVPVGTYTHRANSFHCYEKDLGLLDGYINRIRNGEDMTYDYVDGWDEVMEEYRPQILAQVEELRGR